MINLKASLNVMKMCVLLVLDHAFKYTSYAYDFKGYYYGFPVTVYNLLKVGKKCGLTGLTGYSLGLIGTHTHAYT